MLLKIGSESQDVEKLQIKLGLTPDGSFGKNTEAKVKDWQAKNNLKADGIIGDISWGLMFPVSGEQSVQHSPTAIFKLENLRNHIPDTVIDQIQETSARFNITNTLRLAHFLAQCSHESGSFSRVSENLNYSAGRLKEIFPRFFPGNLSDSYAHNPIKIGSRVYANKIGNGDETSGEGYKFRGRGFIQLTGKSNYASFSKFVNEDAINNPDLVANKYPLASAAFYFNSNNIWSVCDMGNSDEVVRAVTKRVNKGLLGLPERIKHFNEYYGLLR